MPGTTADSWAPRILSRLDPWSTTNPRVRRIDENYYSCSAPCELNVIPYPRTAGPLFGPNAPYADESIAQGVAMTKEGIDPVGLTIPLLGWTLARPPDDSSYNTVVVVGEYDITADFPDRVWNVLALVNGVFGAAYSHSPSALSSPIDVPAENIRVTTNEKEATTTTYLVPPPTLPMLGPFSRVAPRVANADSNVLKPIVDRGYSRYDAGNGNQMPHLKPTDGLPQLVKPTRVTGHLSRSLHPQRDAEPVAAEAAG